MRITILTLRTIASLALLVLAAPFAWATVTGDYYMTVTGGSMRPTYEVGDVLVVKTPAGDELTELGTPVVVSFAEGDRSDQYVHRVEEIVQDGTILKGDGNEFNDPFPVTQDQVLGTPRFVLHGTWGTVFRLSELWAVRAIAGAVFLIALFLPSRGRAARSAEPVTPTAERPTGSAMGEASHAQHPVKTGAAHG